MDQQDKTAFDEDKFKAEFNVAIRELVPSSIMKHVLACKDCSTSLAEIKERAHAEALTGTPMDQHLISKVLSAHAVETGDDSLLCGLQAGLKPTIIARSSVAAVVLCMVEDTQYLIVASPQQQGLIMFQGGVIDIESELATRLGDMARPILKADAQNQAMSELDSMLKAVFGSRLFS